MLSFQLPGISIILIVLSAISFPSCSGSGSSAGSATQIDQNGPIVFDSIQKMKIDTLVMRVNESINAKRLQAKKIPNPLYSPSDSIGVLLTEDHHARISMNMHPDSNILWPYFWVYNGEPVLMRLRTYINDGNERSASEMAVYLTQGKIVFCNERKKELKEGEIPGAVQSEPILKSSRSYGEIENEFKKYWQLAITEMKKNNVLPEWIKS